MATITIRTEEEEKNLIKEFAKFNGQSMSDFIKTTILEKIEDEYDYRIGESAALEYKTSGEEVKPFEELLEKYGIK